MRIAAAAAARHGGREISASVVLRGAAFEKTLRARSFARRRLQAIALLGRRWPPRRFLGRHWALVSNAESKHPKAKYLMRPKIYSRDIQFKVIPDLTRTTRRNRLLGHWAVTLHAGQQAWRAICHGSTWQVSVVA